MTASERAIRFIFGKAPWKVLILHLLESDETHGGVTLCGAHTNFEGWNSPTRYEGMIHSPTDICPRCCQVYVYRYAKGLAWTVKRG